MRLAFLLLALLGVFTTRGGTQIGVLKHGVGFDLTVIWGQPVDVTSALNLENYSISPGELTTARMTATNTGVILTASGLAANAPGILTVSGVLAADMTPLPPETLPFNTGNLIWAAIGGAELGYPPEVTAISSNSFDVFSGGIQQRDEYDEVTFVGEPVMGDFERVVRVEFVEAAGFGAKAGLMVREFLDEGKSRPLDPDDPAGWFSAFAEVAVNSPTTALGDATAPGHHLYRRQNHGQQLIEELSIAADKNANPTFPDAWLKVKRTGGTFSFYRSTNSVDWVELGSTSFPLGISELIHVGVAYTPQNDDLPAGSAVRKSFVAKFRDYGEAPPGTAPKLSIRLTASGTQAEISWTGGGTLESAPTITGPWSAARNQENPQVVELTENAMFFRIQ